MEQIKKHILYWVVKAKKMKNQQIKHINLQHQHQAILLILRILHQGQAIQLKAQQVELHTTQLLEEIAHQHLEGKKFIMQMVQKEFIQVLLSVQIQRKQLLNIE